MYSTSHCLQHRLWQALQSTHRPRALRTTRTQNFAVEAYSGKQKEQLLKGVSADNRGDVARILEQAERAETTWSTVFTDFYTPPVVADAVQALKLVPDILPTPWGGYDMAERKRIRLSRTDMPEDPAAEAAGVSALQVKGNFIFDSANHRDFLGACLGTGIERSKVGDILVQGEQGASILVAPDMVSHLEMNLTSVRSVPVSTRQIELSALSIREAKVQELKSVEASLRLDAIASAGFRTSRSKVVDMVKAGDIRLNWKEAKSSSLVKAGDIISCAGKGRCEVKAVEMTKKERYAVQMLRYV
ncbi:hypothetical protein ABBQ32_010077 [Trebouxia sp. C0010 RCD-2024]